MIKFIDSRPAGTLCVV
jgi:hypothetical protein